MNKKRIISAFPAMGKSFSVKNNDLKLLDLDLPKDQWTNGVETYIEAIKEALTKDYDYILVTSHKELRDALNENNLPYYLVYPNIRLYTEFIGRCIERKSPDKLIKTIADNWKDWITEITEEPKNKNVTKIKVGSEKIYLNDVIKYIENNLN